MGENRKTRDRRPASGGDVAHDDERIRRLLDDVSGGDDQAVDELFGLLYDELRVLAHRQRSRWHGNHTLDTTAILHETYVKLRRQDRIATRTRKHFYALASAAMRHILVNYAERQDAAKRGGELVPVTLGRIESTLPATETAGGGGAPLAALDEALRALAGTSVRASRVVECRLFGGLTIEETASALDISPRTVKRDWSFAQAWLKRELGGDG
jgi:RNA polymerase sigma factor (TIGR02999 family)